MRTLVSFYTFPDIYMGTDSEIETQHTLQTNQSLENLKMCDSIALILGKLFNSFDNNDQYLS